VSTTRPADAAPGLEHRLRRRHDGFEQRDVVAQRLAEAAGLDEVALHVDQHSAVVSTSNA
jgi:hypothetical protein